MQGPGYGYRNKVLVATPVIAVAAGFTIIFCLILVRQQLLQLSKIYPVFRTDSEPAN